MAEVGVLSLQIHDNSEKAASGLNNLASALERVRSAVGGLQSLETISKQIESINKAVRNASTGGTIENLNGLASALKRVKDAASGLDLSKLSMPANTNRPGGQGTRAERKPAVSRVNDAVKGSIAAPIEQAVEQTRELSTETARVAENIQSVSSASNMADGFTEVKSAVEETNQALDEEIEKLRQVNRERNAAADRARLEKQYPQFRELYMSGESPWTSQVPQMYGISGDVIERSETYADAMRAVAEEAERAQRATEAAASAFQSAMGAPRLSSGQSPLLLGAGGVPQENALSTLVDNSAQWKPNWGEPDPEMAEAYASSLRAAAEEAERIQIAIEATASAFQSMMGAPRLGGGQNPLLLGSGGVPQENALSTWTDSSAQWKPDWTGGEYNQGLIIGEGYVSDAAEVSESALSAASDVQESTGLIIASTASAASGVQESTGLIVASAANTSGAIDKIEDSAANTSGAMDQIGDSATNASDAMSQVKYGTDEAQVSLKDLLNTTDGAKSGMNSLASGVESMSRPLFNLARQLWNVAKRMAMRAVIRAFVGGIKEGVENLYWYSKAVGTSFAPAMDNAASSMLLLKNSIGAMLGPLIESLVPVLQTVVNWLVTAINYANQFFSLLAGKNGWTRAVPVAAEAFEKTSQSTKSAAKEMKDLLADWDELNIIQSESGDGGGGGSGKKTPDYASMFEEVDSYNEGIASFFKNLEDSFGSILDMVKLIGAGILAWKISSALGGALGTIAGLVAAGIVLDITFKLVRAFDNTYADTGKIGWLVGDVLTTLIGATLMKGILFKVLGGKAASISLPLTFAVSAAATITAIIDQTDLSALNPRTITQAVLAALKGGAAAGLTAFKFGGLTKLAAAGAGLSGALVTFGITMGLKATSVVVDTGEITKETILADVVAAVSTTLGAAGLALAFGASAPVVAAAAAGALLFTAAATIGLQLAIVNKPDAISWGSYSATLEEIKNFVSGTVFKVGANTILNLIDPKIEAVSSSDADLTATADSVKLSVSKILLGFDDKESLKDLEAQVLGTDGDDSNSLIGKFKKSVKDKKIAIETGLTLQFTNYGTGTVDGGEEAQQQFALMDAGWNLIDQQVSDLGTMLSESFGRAYQEGITEEAKKAELKTIAELTQMIANVSGAITSGEAWADAQINLNSNLGNLSRETFGDVLEYVKQYKDEVVSAYTKSYDEVTKQIGGQVAGLKQSMENEYKLADETTGEERERHLKNAEAYKAQYEETSAWYKSRMAGRNDAIKDWTNSAMDNDTVDTIKESVKGFIQGKAGIDFISAAFSDEMYRVFHDAASTKEDKTGAVTDLLNNMIDQYFGEDAETIKGLIKEGVLGYADVIDESVLDVLSEGGIWEGEQDVWQMIISEIFGTDKKPVELEGPDVNAHVGVKPEIEEATSEASTSEELLGGLAEEADKNLKAADSVIREQTYATNPVDTSATTNATGDMAAQVHSDVLSVANDINWLNSMVGGYGYSGVGGAGRFSSVTGVKVYSRATGGNIRSGEMFFANENGNIEMMGKMGNSPVVANNQQIVDGISKGVAASNSGMESAMNMMVTLMRQFVNKEFTAKVVPSSSMGRSNAMSNEAYRKVTG